MAAFAEKIAIDLHLRCVCRRKGQGETIGPFVLRGRESRYESCLSEWPIPRVGSMYVLISAMALALGWFRQNHRNPQNMHKITLETGTSCRVCFVPVG